MNSTIYFCFKNTPEVWTYAKMKVDKNDKVVNLTLEQDDVSFPLGYYTFANSKCKSLCK